MLSRLKWLVHCYKIIFLCRCFRFKQLRRCLHIYILTVVKDNIKILCSIQKYTVKRFFSSYFRFFVCLLLSCDFLLGIHYFTETFKNLVKYRVVDI
jgi:hypothetical protein